MGDQSKRISCLKESVLENLNRLLERWNIVDDKNLFSQELLQDVPKLTQESQNLMDKALKEEYSDSDSLLEQLNILNTSLVETTIKIEWDTNRIYTEKRRKSKGKIKVLF